MKRRSSGILLHISSLPSPLGIGDFGPGAYEFVDDLVSMGQSYWQILPLNPTTGIMCHSPYSSYSSFGMNPLFISPQLLLEEGYIDTSDLSDMPVFPQSKVEYDLVVPYKEVLCTKAFQRFREGPETETFRDFCRNNAYWLDDHAMFVVLKSVYKEGMWSQWPVPLRDRQDAALEEVRRQYHLEIEYQRFIQYLVFSQWYKVKAYANEKGVQIFGDIPIYVTYDSVDVWKDPHIFQLDKDKNPTSVAGVPPDYFSATGQLWGNPLYNWDVLKKEGFRWWINRMRHMATLVDMVRIDHFRGLVAYWAVPAGEPTAVNGKWIEAPVYDFLAALLKYFPALPLIAEDLGVITPDVRETMREFSLPGMKILMFGFGTHDPYLPYLPHNFYHNSVVYTGTHDNNTLKGWFRCETDKRSLERLKEYIGFIPDTSDIHWEMIRLAMRSISNTVITPMQDVLGLDEDARMNRPSTGSGNWAWRLAPGMLTPEIKQKLRSLTETFERV